MARPPRKTPPSGDYRVGYGKPPEHSRFREGHKPPPRKPKKPEAPDLGAFLAEELSRIVTIPAKDDQPAQKLPVGKLLIRQVVAQAIKKGDLRQLLPLLPKGRGEADQPLSDLDLEIIKRALSEHTGLKGEQ